MDALFIIPALISPSVPERLVPGLAKMVERNTVLTYSSTIRIAALKRYANAFKTATSESDSSLLEGPGGQGKPQDNHENTGGRQKKSNNMSFPFDKSGSSSSKEVDKAKLEKMKPDEIEIPKGISFFNTVSLEPTFLELPIEQKKNVFGLSGTSERFIRIGFKCIPYKLDGVTDIKNYIRDTKNIAITQSFLKRKLTSMQKRLWMTAARDVYKGKETTGNIIKDILMGPSSEDLSNPNILASLMDSRGPSRWSSLMMFTTFDFEDLELKEVLDDYRNIVKAGWGDMVIINENRESINFCTTKMLSCYDFPYTYLREILKMGNVIDYREIKGYTRPFSMVSLRSALKESVNPSDL